MGFAHSSLIRFEGSSTTTHNVHNLPTMRRISLIVAFSCLLPVVSSMPQPGGWGYNPGHGGNGGGGYNPDNGGNGCNGNTRPDYHDNGCNNGGNGHHNGNTRPDYHGK